tara:strand:+ start:416 stop:736 length:321 start_codon:yes stop_codon:yes gene_type:complete
MSLKYNINLIHSNIKELYKETNIKESSDKKFGNYFKFNIISEGKELIIIVNKKDLEGNVFNWKYYSDPLNEDSHLVERTSDLYNISEHIKDIFDKNRFDNNYLKNI